MQSRGALGVTLWVYREPTTVWWLKHGSEAAGGLDRAQIAALLRDTPEPFLAAVSGATSLAPLAMARDAAAEARFLRIIGAEQALAQIWRPSSDDVRLLCSSGWEVREITYVIAHTARNSAGSDSVARCYDVQPASADSASSRTQGSRSRSSRERSARRGSSPSNLPNAHAA